MNFIDIIILVIILFAGINGFRKGVINSVVTFVGTILVLIIAFYLKNPISTLLYTYLPFFKLGGIFKGITVFNILIYEAISYLLTISLLGIIFGVITKVTGIVSKLVNSTIILGFPSKILGAVVGFLEGFILAFILVFIFSLISSTSSKVLDSKYGNKLLLNAPFLSSVIEDTYKGISEVYSIAKSNLDKEEANAESLDVLLKYEILSVNSARKLDDSDKLNIKGASIIIDKYDKKQNLN